MLAVGPSPPSRTSSGQVSDTNGRAVAVPPLRELLGDVGVEPGPLKGVRTAEYK